ncbi:hypothetical protein VA7868_00439 [Vibrio aerogenes CECT 7868]|uniref:Uncharacterized protein n=1 Tax=Vibrio aerogenes CECT 7868 TaxID=1216006 RepID=A0A1M5VM84_9VIBR|nr:hypothetical protein [Vibrio aerogenes]SHH76278.1 hypothetical protein VA7868_00439 [Vibrio aerogenes CECT 7868]
MGAGQDHSPEPGQGDIKKDREQTANIADKSLAQSGALAVQDAANSYRDMNTLLTTASGVALANFIETGDAQYLKALDTINHQAQASKNNFIDLYMQVNQARQGNQKNSDLDKAAKKEDGNPAETGTVVKD